MKKGVKIAIGLATIGIVGVGGYFLWKKVIKPKLDKNKEKAEGEKEDVKTEEEVRSTNYNKKNNANSSGGKTPFKNATEGNAFRGWINDNYPTYAKSLLGDGLDRTGGFDNRHIRKAWTEYGVEYEQAKKNEGAVYTATYGQSFSDIMNHWKKSHLLSTNKDALNVPYFSLSMKCFTNDSVFLTKLCNIWIFIYDRKAGENVGGKNGQGFFKITDSDGNLIAYGRWDNMLKSITLEGVGSSGDKVKTLKTLYYLDSRIGSTFAGSSAGQNFSDLLIGKRGYTWC